MEIKFKVIQPRKGELEKQLWDALKKQIETKLKDVKCPDHNLHPRLVVSGTLHKPDFKINGCCQKLIDMTSVALK